MKIPKQIERSLQDPKAVFICSHSGGKDSQEMYIQLKHIVPADRLIVIHAHLPGVEWEGTEEFIRSTIEHEFHVVQAKKTFFDMVRNRKMFPSSQHRQCTSDLKRDPIDKKVREICKDRGFTTVISCMGLRAQESPARRKQRVIKINKRNRTSSRAWFNWLPIHKMLETQVFEGIAAAGQEPFWTYGAGMSRKSCCFCILANGDDLCIAAKLRPELLDEIDELEDEVDHTLRMPKKGEAPVKLKEVIRLHKEKRADEQKAIQDNKR